MTPDLNDRVAVVTGGGSGIGAALCRRLAGNGASVVVADIDGDSAGRVAVEIDGMALSLDVADRDGWARAVSAVTSRYRRLDLLALNAGIMCRPLGEPSNDDPLQWISQRYEAVRSVNIDGVMFGIMAALPHLEATAGRIVCTASTAGLNPLNTDPVYTMTKHAVIGLVRSLAPSLAERGVGLGAVCPGAVDTPIVPSELRTTGLRLATPEHIAEALEAVLCTGITDTGGIWVCRGDDPMWRHEFAPSDTPPSTSPSTSDTLGASK